MCRRRLLGGILVTGDLLARGRTRRRRIALTHHRRLNALPRDESPAKFPRVECDTNKEPSAAPPKRAFFENLPEVVLRPGRTWSPADVESVSAAIFGTGGFHPGHQARNRNLRKLHALLVRKVTGADAADVEDGMADCALKFLGITKAWLSSGGDAEATGGGTRGYLSFDPTRGSFESWFFGVIFRFVILDLRKIVGRKLGFESIEPPEPKRPSGHVEFVQNIARPDVFAALDRALTHVERVAPEHRTPTQCESFRLKADIIRHRYLRDWSYAEIATKFKMSEANARVMVSRGLVEMTAILGEDGRGPEDFLP